jgi:hypothetical protein
VRLGRYLVALRHELLRLALVCGEPHPALVGLDHFELLDDPMESRPVAQVVGYRPGWGLPGEADRDELRTLMA